MVHHRLEKNADDRPGTSEIIVKAAFGDPSAVARMRQLGDRLKNLERKVLAGDGDARQVYTLVQEADRGPAQDKNDGTPVLLGAAPAKPA